MKDESGFGVHKYDLAIGIISPSKVSIEQQKKIENILLVAFLSKDQRKVFINISRRLKKNNKYFYQNKNLHATLFGFGPMSKNDYQVIRRQIQLFTESQKVTLNIKFESKGLVLCTIVTKL